VRASRTTRLLRLGVLDGVGDRFGDNEVYRVFKMLGVGERERLADLLG
jgi:hypothetical protein